MKSKRFISAAIIISAILTVMMGFVLQADAAVTAKIVKTPLGTKIECLYDPDFDAYYLLATTKYGVAFFPGIVDDCPEFSNPAIIDTTRPGWKPTEYPKCEGPNHDTPPEGASICQWP